MRGVNKVILLGRLGKDPDVKNTQGGLEIANFSLATSERWKDKSSGEMQERTEWHNCTAFGKTAELIREYLHKGSMVYCEGKLNTQKYQDKETGSDRYATKIIVDNIQMLDSKPKDNAPTQQAHNDLNDDIPF